MNLGMESLLNLGDQIWFSIHKPKRTVQLIFLNEIKALLWGGTIDSIDKRILEMPKFKFHRKRTPSLVSSELSISEKLSLLGFDKEAVLALQRGEATGKSLEGLNIAINHLDMLSTTQGQAYGKIMSSFTALFVSLSLLIFLPGAVFDTLTELMNSGLTIQTGITTDLLLFLGESNTPMLLTIIVLVIALIMSYLICNEFKVSTPIHRYFATRRSLSLLTIWRMHRQAGVPLDTEYTTLKSTVGSRVFKDMQPQLIDGTSLAGVIATDRHSFSSLLTFTAESMSELGGERFSDVSHQIIKSLFAEHKVQVERLVQFLSWTSITVAVLAISLLAYGMIFPIMSIQAGF